MKQMKLIIKEYLSALKERDELDIVLPDLLSELGLNILSKPIRRGTRQYGVDIAAVGQLDEKPEALYLISIKPGNVTREAWDSDPQSLRQSLNDILDVYIPTHIPPEHKSKKIVICICLGGEVLEGSVRLAISNYTNDVKTKNPSIEFIEWNGDKLAEMILSNFLQEKFLPSHLQSHLRKSLALLDEPEASYRHFKDLILTITKRDFSKDADKIKALRQLNICLWILYTWAREINNIESPYLSSELILLHSWELSKEYFSKQTKTAQAIQSTFLSILEIHKKISYQYLSEKIIPLTGKKHSISSAVLPSNHIDVNLKLFDILGRLAVGSLWVYHAKEIKNESEKNQDDLGPALSMLSAALKNLIINNPVLLSPLKEDQTIDILMALSFLALDSTHHDFIKEWLNTLFDNAVFAYQFHRSYPSILNSYSDLLSHPKIKNDEYRHQVTMSSIFYPTIALWAALMKDDALYKKIQSFKKDHLKHCNFQCWYPDEMSEENFYTNQNTHGSTLVDVYIEQSAEEFMTQVFGECNHIPRLELLSAVRFGLWPIILVACRHYRLPLPCQIIKDLNIKAPKESGLKK